MSEVFRCEDKDTLVAYLYGEVDADVRREVERHLRTCSACTRETEGLQHVRQDLQLWMPPEPALGFGIVQKAPATPAPVLTSSRFATLHQLPVWVQAAAAVLVVAVGAGIANVQVRSTSDGITVTTGWMQPAVTPMAADPVIEATDPEWRRELVALEQNLRAEIASQQDAIKAATMPRQPDTNADRSALLVRVQKMIEESEERQQQEMALRFIQADRVWSSRWSTDRATMTRQLGSLQGRTLAVQAGQQEMMNQFKLQRVSAPREPNQ